MTDIESNSDAMPCRYCRQPVHPLATKCPHCGEHLTDASQSQRIGKKILAAVGVTTALLSLFFGLKEGYFFVEQRQQQREMFAAHLSAAEHFLKLDNLEHSEASLNRALDINPNDTQLQLRYFLLRARNLLREADYYGVQLPDEYMAVMPELITRGFSLIENDFASHDQARLLLSLARLLQYDRRWQTPDAVAALFADARALSPHDADVAYWYGEWLMNQAPPDEHGLSLMQEAVQRQPDNALYHYGLGRYQARRQDYAVAIESLKQAILLRPKQHELQTIRAANEAEHALRQALLDADTQNEITGTDFYGLSMSERIALAEFALEHGSSNRRLWLLSARLFHANNRHAEAEALLRKILGDYNQRSDKDNLELFAAVLDAQEKNAEANQVRQLLAQKHERELYEEILETGYEGKHRYKVGLKVAKQNEGEGIEVIKAYEGYPFAKAGIQSGDQLLEFAHRKVENLRSIWVPINDFSPGTDVPLKIRRGNEELSLTVIIE